jgi:hypothetical protein
MAGPDGTTTGAAGGAHELALLTGPDAAGILATALAAVGGELLWWRPRQVVHRPGRDTTVSYRARVRWPDGQAADETLAACTGAVPDGALVLDDGTTSVAAWRFPHDPHLPGLARACDAAAVAALLEDLGLGSGAVHLRTRAYRPRRRAVIEATGSRGRLFLKVVRPDRVEALHQRHRLMAAAGIPVPESLGWTTDGILALQALPGQSLRHALRSRATPIPSGQEILALLDGLPADLAAGPPRPSWIDKAPHYAAVVAAALPTEAGRVTGLAGSLVAESRRVGPAATHGDFYEAQLLVRGGQVCGLLDVDTAGPGERIDDLACLIGHLSVLAQIDRARAPIINRAAARYLAAFDDAAAPAELRRRVAAVVLSLATGAHRVHEAGWRTTTHRRLDLAAAWLDRAREHGSSRRMSNISRSTQGHLISHVHAHR